MNTTTTTTSSKRKCDDTTIVPSTKHAKVEPTPGGMRHYYELPHPSTWTFNVRTNDKTGSTMIYVNDANKKKLTFQLPRMRSPFGVREPQSTPGNEESTSRPNLDLDVDDDRLVAWGRSVDTVMIDYIVEHSDTLFKSKGKGKVKKSREVVEEMFRPIIPASTNSDYNPLMRTKYVKGTNKWSTKVVVEKCPGSDTTPLRYLKDKCADDICANDEVTAIVDLTGIWVANNNTGMSVSLSSALVHKSASESEFNFLLPAGVMGAEAESEEDVKDEPETCPDDDVEAPAADVCESDPFA